MMMSHSACCNLHSVVYCSSRVLPNLLPCHFISENARCSKRAPQITSLFAKISAKSMSLDSLTE